MGSLFKNPARAAAPAVGNRPAGGLNIENIQSVKRMMSMYRATKNPDAALAEMERQNPVIKNIMQVCGPGGLQNSFYQLCREQGVDPNEVLRQLQ